MFSSVCRVCLSSNLRMSSIENIELQNIFEKLTSIKLNSSGDTESMCFFCYSELQRCSRFAAKARRSAALLKDISDKGYMATQETLEMLKVEPIRALSENSPQSMHTITFEHSDEEITNKIESTPGDEINAEDMLKDAKPVKVEVFYVPDMNESNSCDLCSKTFDATSKLVTHYRRIHACKLNSRRRKNLKRKPLDKSLYCAICSKTFTYKHNYERHKVSCVHAAKEKPPMCDICNKTFSRNYDLKRHRSIHSIENQTCSECNKTFSCKRRLNEHMRFHTLKISYPCDLCDISFTQSSYLDEHVKVHKEEKPYTCDRCAKTFTSNGNLQKHMVTHTGEKPYSCNRCDKAFARKEALTLHYRVHTGEKPYACTVCHKTFSQKSTLNVHKKIHTGERPFACDICGKTFGDKYTFRRHMGLHSGAQPYVCQECGKAYSSHSSLYVHRRTHGPATRTAVCHVCSKTFTNNNDLKRHMRNVHKDIPKVKADTVCKI